MRSRSRLQTESVQIDIDKPPNLSEIKLQSLTNPSKIDLDKSIKSSEFQVRKLTDGQIVIYPIVEIREIDTNIKLKTLLDTGACTTLMSEESAKKLNLMTYPAEIKFSGVNETKVECTKCVPIKLIAGHKIRMMAAYVIQNLNNEMLFGINVINYAHTAIIAQGENNQFKIRRYMDGNLLGYDVEIQRPSSKEIELLFKAWFGEKFDQKKLRSINDLSESERLKEAYFDNKNIISLVQELPYREDFPEPIDNIERELKETINPELSPYDKQKLFSCLLRNKDAFSVSPYDLGCVPAHVCNIKINIGDKPIPKKKPFRLQEKVRLESRKIIDELKQNDIVQVSYAGGGAPAFVVPKPNGTWRMVISYVELSKLIEKRVYPMPNIDDAINMLKGNKYFKTLDLAQGYYQIELPESERDKTSFVTEEGTFRFVRLPM